LLVVSLLPRQSTSTPSLAAPLALQLATTTLPDDFAGGIADGPPQLIALLAIVNLLVLLLALCAQVDWTAVMLRLLDASP
jgi:hypothetical protein